MIHDIRYAIRSLIKHRTFTATSLATIALGIGVTTAIFSIVDAVAFRALPFRNPDRLVQLYGTPAARGEAVDHLFEFRGQSTSFEAVVGYGVSARYLQGPAGTDRVMTVAAERDFFSMLGVAPLLGRTFRSDDPANVAVISQAFWNRRLSSSPIGAAITLDGQQFTVIGVMPDRFQFPYGAASTLSGAASELRTDVWMPLEPPSNPEARARLRFNYVTARLKDGVSVAAAETELALIAQRLQIQNPDRYGPRGIRLAALSDVVVAPQIRGALFLLFAAVGIILALACANVTNLSLVRMTLRSRDVAVRSAIGAARVHLIRQFLAESLLLSFTGGLAGLAIGIGGAAWLRSKASALIPRIHEASIDWRVFVFVFALCTAAALVFGLAPVLAAIRTDPAAILQRAGDRHTNGAGHKRLREVLVIGEIALAFVLAAAAGLLIREVVRLRNTETGMVTENVVTFHVGHRMVSRGRERPFDSDIRRFYDIAERVRHLPEARAAGFIQALPLQNWGWQATSTDLVRGRTSQQQTFSIELRYVTPGYFQALGIPLRKGRTFSDADNREAAGVIVINEALARQYFGSEDPIGQETTRGIIVGIVGDVRQAHLDREAAPEVYYPLAQNWSQLSELGMTLVVGTRDRPEPLIDAIRSIIRDVDPNLAVFDIKTMDRVIADSLADFVLYLSLITMFAILAVALALTGTYGVVSFATASRTREFAIRFAVGATRSQVMASIVREGLILAGAGILLGTVLTFAAAPMLRNLSVNIGRPNFAVTFSIALLVGIVAIAAAALPARRAADVDPITALRHE